MSVEDFVKEVMKSYAKLKGTTAAAADKRERSSSPMRDVAKDYMRKGGRVCIF
jgi:hypothetical protein